MTRAPRTSSMTVPADAGGKASSLRPPQRGHHRGGSTTATATRTATRSSFSSAIAPLSPIMPDIFGAVHVFVRVIGSSARAALHALRSVRRRLLARLRARGARENVRARGGDYEDSAGHQVGPDQRVNGDAQHCSDAEVHGGKEQEQCSQGTHRENESGACPDPTGGQTQPLRDTETSGLTACLSGTEAAVQMALLRMESRCCR